jgi:sec-independent protein translocase protein TatC
MKMMTINNTNSYHASVSPAPETPDFSEDQATSKDERWSNDPKITLTAHLIELRSRLIFCVLTILIFFGISYYFAQDIYNFLTAPLAEIYKDHSGKRMIYTSLTEAFTTYIKLSFLSSLFFSFPIIAAQFYLFIAPGLYKSEKKTILLTLIFSPILFLMGAALAYYFIFPLSFKFFLGFEVFHNGNNLPIELEAKISEYLDLVIQLIFAFGIAFQLPILLIFLVKIGMISVEGLRAKRKYWIVGFFAIAAICTPPDVLSQISLAVPLVILYEISIIISTKINK